MPSVNVNAVILNTTYQKIAEVSSGVPFSYMSFNIANDDPAAPVAVSIAIASPAAQPGRINLITPPVNIDPNGKYVEEGILVKSGEAVFMKVTTGSAIARVTSMDESVIA